MLLSKEIVAKTKNLLMGAVAGAVVLAIVGFSWGGWVTAGTAEKLADRKAADSVVLALAPMCVDNFRHQTDAGAQLVNFQKLSSYDQSSFVEKGGWATALGSKEYSTAITHACAKSLSALTAADLG
jgi:pimeloyl-ACP methyl ester carboxylesterase